MPSSRNPSPGVSPDKSDSCGLSPAETPRRARKAPADKRARSLDRQGPRMGSESPNSRRPSGPTYRRMLRRTASDGARSSGSSSHFVEARGAAAPGLPLEEEREDLPSEQGPPEDTKKEKPPGWMKILLNLLLLRSVLEDPREKASRKSKGEPSELPEAAEEPALKKKSQEKRTTGRKKHGHRKPGAEEPTGLQNSEAEGQEDVPPSLAASQPGEADLGPMGKGGPDSARAHAMSTEGGHEEPSGSSAHSAGLPSEEETQKPDQEEVIRKIVELLKKAGDQLEEEEAQVPQPEVVAPEVVAKKQTPPPRKKSQEKKPNLKRALSLKRPASEEPKRVGATTALGPETRPKRPSFLPLCVSSQQTSASGSHDLEGPGFREVPSTDDGGSRPSDFHTPAGSQGPAERPLLDRASESREFRRKILALLQSSEDEKAEQQVQIQDAEEAGENPAPGSKGKSQGKKSNLRRAFSLRKHSSKDSKRAEASGTLGAASPEARPPRRHGFLPMCVGGHRASISGSSEGLESHKLEAARGGPAGSPEAPSQARSYTPDEGPSPEGAPESKELIIHKLVSRLQEVDSELGRQIRQYPSFRSFFNEFSDTSLRKLVATLDRRKARLSEEEESLANRTPPCAFGALNKFAASRSCAICTLMQSRGQYQGHSYAHFLSRKAQQNITSLVGQSPD